eukprot:jgi/Chlat1/6938/Chrsp52S06604
MAGGRGAAAAAAAVAVVLVAVAAAVCVAWLRESPRSGDAGDDVALHLKLTSWAFQHVYVPLALNGRIGWLRQWIADGPLVKADERFKHGVATRDVDAGGVSVRLFLPQSVHADGSKLPLIVYMHGGGFVIMRASSTIYDDFCRHLAHKSSLLVASIDYRRAPDHRYPAAHDDVYSALHWISKHAESEPWLAKFADISRTVLIGDSAGGNLAHYAALQANQSAEMLQPLRVVAQALLYPVTAGSQMVDSERRWEHWGYMISYDTMRTFMDAYFGPDFDWDHPHANPPAQHLQRLPPTYVAAAEHDVLLDRNRMYVAGILAQNVSATLVVYPKKIHGFLTNPLTPVDDAILEDVLAFVHTHTDVS